jgi:hypothetical protein
VNTPNVSDVSSETENCRSDFDFNAVQNEAKYNKSGNNMLTAKAKNHGCKKKKNTSPHDRIILNTY